MDNTTEERCRNLLISLRTIIQAIDQHSTMLQKNFGLTSSQLIILQEISNHGQITVTQLAKAVSLSQATVTDITKRLKQKEYLIRKKSESDKRKVDISLSDKGIAMLQKIPPLLQEKFTDNFSKLDNWEQLMIESAFDRVVHMMSAKNINASPIMVTGSLNSTRQHPKNITPLS